jgi:biotin carboxyl carrier protein
MATPDSFEYDQAPAPGRVIRAPISSATMASTVAFAMAACAVAALCLVQVALFTEGQAVVMDGAQAEVRSLHDGLTGDILVTAGQRVQAGDLVAQIHTAGGAQHPLHAPAAGVVTGVWARPGQTIQFGQRLLSIHSQRPGCLAAYVILPVHALGYVRPQQRIRLSVDGFPRSYQDLRLSWVASEAISPAEMKRYLGPERAGLVTGEQALLLARADLPVDRFTSDDGDHQLVGGMSGRALVYTRSERLILALVSRLRHFGFEP